MCSQVLQWIPSKMCENVWQQLFIITGNWSMVAKWLRVFSSFWRWNICPLNKLTSTNRNYKYLIIDTCSFHATYYVNKKQPIIITIFQNKITLQSVTKYQYNIKTPETKLHPIKQLKEIITLQINTKRLFHLLLYSCIYDKKLKSTC